MDSNAMKKRGQAFEDDYFRKANAEAMKRLQEKESDKPLKSPITGEPMERLMHMGVVIDRCPTSKGIWLDAGELEQIIEASRKEDSSKESGGLLGGFFQTLAGK